MQEQRDHLVLRDDLQSQHPAGIAPYQPLPLGGLAAQHTHTPHDEDEVDVLGGVFRHVWIVIIFMLLGLGGAIAYLRIATPMYRSFAKIYIEPSGPRVLTESFTSVQRASYLFTQCEVMRSASVLNIVAETPGIRGLSTFDKYGGNPVFYLREYLVAEVGRKDDIITIVIDSPYPEDTPKIVNAVVDAYQKYQNTEKRTKSSDMLETLLKSKKKTDDKIKHLSDQMIAFQRANPTLPLNEIVNQEMSALSHAYVQAQLATIDARTRPTYAAGHPAVLSAVKREEELRNRYEQAQKRHTDINALTADQQRMNTELLTERELARGLDQRVKEVEVNKDAEQIFNSVTVLEPALLPVKPSSPRKYRTLAIALSAGTLLGAGLALLRDRMDGRMRSVEDIQTMIGLSVLGVVPAMSGRRTAVARAMTVHLDPRSVVAESYRTIRTAVYFGAGSNRCKTILVTSPEPGDGKTTSASNLAIAIAQTGRSVLLLDADFRKPTQHKNLDIKDSVGLSSVLAGREPITKAIQHTGVEGLDILPCGPIPANPSEILNSREFGELVDSLAGKYDHILFDSPPVNAVTDARILGAVCDATILVLRADKSTRKAGEHARNALMGVGARVLGVIVNDAPRRKGYEVYGGTYYGQTDIMVRSHDAYDSGSIRPSLPRPLGAQE